MKKLNIVLSQEVKSSPAKTWNIIGPDFINISYWARGILKSWKNESAPRQFENTPAGGRFCEIKGFGTMDEKIIHYDPEKMEISWSAFTPKLPGFVKNLQNEVKVERIDDKSSRASVNISADLSGVRGLFLGSVLKKNFTKQMQAFLKDWKTYAETGDISEAKKREKNTLK